MHISYKEKEENGEGKIPNFKTVAGKRKESGLERARRTLPGLVFQAGWAHKGCIFFWYT